LSAECWQEYKINRNARDQPDQKINHVMNRNFVIRRKHNPMASSVMTGTPGQRKVRGKPGCVFLMIKTAIEIITNADNVPMLVNSAYLLCSVKPLLSGVVF
jgi:hypothetical protein